MKPFLFASVTDKSSPGIYLIQMPVKLDTAGVNPVSQPTTIAKLDPSAVETVWANMAGAIGLSGKEAGESWYADVDELEALRFALIAAAVTGLRSTDRARKIVSGVQDLPLPNLVFFYNALATTDQPNTLKALRVFLTGDA